MVDVFREVRRVLRDDGTLWLNLGDSYAGKNLSGIPWRVAFALQEDGWYLRQDIIWHKPNPMPESVTDRCTKAHEYIFLMAKSQRYYYDAEAVKEVSVDPVGSEARYKYAFTGRPNLVMPDGKLQHIAPQGFRDFNSTRNRRSVWTVATHSFAGAHFATFPPDLIKPCILAGCPEGGTVLDPFFGSGTTGVVATQLGRKYLGIELNPSYVDMAKRRILEEGDLTLSLFTSERLGVSCV